MTQLLKTTKTGRGRTREFARQRDNYTCQDCGLVRTPADIISFNKESGITNNLRGLKLFDVHHLNGLCGRKNRPTSYDKISDIPGLITLCHKCHFNRHDRSLKLRGDETKRKERERLRHLKQTELLKESIIRNQRRQKILELRESGMTFQQIGLTLNVSRQRIHQIVNNK